jgi:LysR family hydrogen peroxide-inducible transcriptional activator
VGAIQTVAPFFIPAVLAYCRANDVRLRLHTHEDFRRSLIEEVYNGKLDWALVSLPLNEPRLQVEKLYSEPLWLALGAGHPLARAEHIKFADLRDETFILLGEASTLALQIERFCGEHDFEPRIGHRCGQLATVKAFAAMGLGVSVLPQSARSATDPEGLVFRKFSGIAPSRDIALVRHRGRHLGAGAGLFADIARAVVGPVPAAGSTAPFRPAGPAAT